MEAIERDNNTYELNCVGKCIKNLPRILCAIFVITIITAIIGGFISFVVVCIYLAAIGEFHVGKYYFVSSDDVNENIYQDDDYTIRQLNHFATFAAKIVTIFAGIIFTAFFVIFVRDSFERRSTNNKTCDNIITYIFYKKVLPQTTIISTGRNIVPNDLNSDEV